MPRTIRSTNVDLIRWLNYGHDRTAQKLASVTNSTYLSKMATGDMAVSDRKARAIERALDLPAGWLDRDNIAIFKMSVPEFDLYQRVAELSDESRTALKVFLSSVQR